MEQSRDPKNPDQRMDEPEEKLKYHFNKLPKGKPISGPDGTRAWEETYNLQEVRELL